MLNGQTGAENTGQETAYSVQSEDKASAPAPRAVMATPATPGDLLFLLHGPRAETMYRELDGGAQLRSVSCSSGFRLSEHGTRSLGHQNINPVPGSWVLFLIWNNL